MNPLIVFNRVSKRYRLHHDRPRAFRDLFVRRPAPRRDAARPDVLWALQDVSLALPRGETLGLVGPNGAGKSTVLRLISRVIAPTTGRVEISGRVAALLELGTGFHPDLSGRDNIYLSGALVGLSRRDMRHKYESVVAFSELEEFIDLPVKHYSSGMFARLAFAVSIHLEPEVLLVDEVLAVGDQAFQQKCLDRLSALRAAGVTICLVSHSLDTVRAMCSRALWIDHGQIHADGSADAVVRQYLDHVHALDEKRLAEGAALHASQRWGNRQVEIVRVRLRDAEGHDRTMFETGQKVELLIEYQTLGPVMSPVFGMAIHRSDGLHICGPNTAFAGLKLPVLEGRGMMSYSIPCLPLLEGLYQISVAVVNQDDTQVYDYHDRAYPFRVVNRDGTVQEKYGLLTVRGEWQHAPGEDKAIPMG